MPPSGICGKPNRWPRASLEGNVNVPHTRAAMRHSTRRRWTVLTALVLVVAALPAPVVAQASYDFPNGTVEVLGLRRWTLAMLRDSIRRYVPGQDLHDAAC